MSLHAKSSSAYRELQDVLILPSERTLINYKNVFKPKPGIHKGKIQQLQDQVSSYSGCQRYIGVVFDEMKIKSSLVFNKHTDEIVGFTDLGDPALTFSSFEDEQPVATTVIAFFVRGLMTSLKFILCYFFTSGVATSFQIFNLFWQVVSVLELKVDLWCVAATADGGSPNRKFFKLHKGLQCSSHTGVIYYTINLFAQQRYVYFFADVPHLIKTTRNCLYSSGWDVGRIHTRCMWNNDKYLLWSFIEQAYYRDQEGVLQHLPKITLDHIKLSSFGKMKVSLAVQVFSKSMANALRYFNPDGEADELAKFLEMVNDFFDMANTRSTKEHLQKRNPNLRPYQDPNDERLTWMTDVFLPYLEQWKVHIAKRSGFTKEQQQMMFLSLQTYEGYQITINSMVNVIKFLLRAGFSFVLTERLMQDVLEEYFGYQRASGRRSENPTAHEFGYNDITINMQRTIKPKGNVHGRHKGHWDSVIDEPLPKHPKPMKKT